MNHITPECIELIPDRLAKIMGQNHEHIRSILECLRAIGQPKQPEQSEQPQPGPPEWPGGDDFAKRGNSIFVRLNQYVLNDNYKKISERDYPKKAIEVINSCTDVFQDNQPQWFLMATNVYYGIVIMSLQSILQKTSTVNNIIELIDKYISDEYYMEEINDVCINVDLNDNSLFADVFTYFIDSRNPVFVRICSSVQRQLFELFLLETSRIRKPSSTENLCSETSPGPIDFFQPLFQKLFPRRVRHALGEYYTPQWLVDQVLEDMHVRECAADIINGRCVTFLDPSCGSGRFLLSIMNIITSQYNKYIMSSCLPECESPGLFSCQLFGCDVNPLSVWACRANLRLNVWFDSFFRHCRRLRTVSDELPKPPELERFDSIELRDFLLEPNVISEPNVKTVRCTMPLEFDFIVGNPPWIAWDNLPDYYRQATKPLWLKYGLFSLDNRSGRYGGAKKDLSSLVFCRAADMLKSAGRLGFVIPKSLMFTTAGDGFRRFHLPDGTGLAVTQVRDFSRMNVFGTTAAKACTITVARGNATEYPVSYIIHTETDIRQVNARPLDTNNPASKWTLGGYLANVHTEHNNTDDNLCDMSISSDVLRDGASDYQAYIGANTGGANGIYWFEILGEVDETHVRVRNLFETSLKPVERLETVVETGLLYPLVRWKQVDQWHIRPIISERTGQPGDYAILVVQDPVTRKGISEELMVCRYPLAMSYLSGFCSLLERRAAQTRYQFRNMFYSMYNIGTYTMSPWKVVWRRMDSRIRASVLGPKPLIREPQTCESLFNNPLLFKPVLPQETCVFIPVASEPEGLYLTAVLNSCQVHERILASNQSGGKSFGSTNLLHYCGIRKFKPEEPEHVRLADAAERLRSEVLKKTENFS